MKLDARAFGLAAGATAGVLFILCALAVAIAPEATTAFAGYLIHTDLSGMMRTLTVGSFVGGLICWTIGAALVFWLTGAIYNRLTGVSSGARVADQRPASQRA
jgi:2TM family of unknown function (DUF5676)